MKIHVMATSNFYFLKIVKFWYDCSKMTHVKTINSLWIYQVHISSSNFGIFPTD